MIVPMVQVVPAEGVSHVVDGRRVQVARHVVAEGLGRVVLWVVHPAQAVAVVEAVAGDFDADTRRSSGMRQLMTPPHSDRWPWNQGRYIKQNGRFIFRFETEHYFAVNCFKR